MILVVGHIYTDNERFRHTTCSEDPKIEPGIAALHLLSRSYNFDTPGIVSLELKGRSESRNLGGVSIPDGGRCLGTWGVREAFK